MIYEKMVVFTLTMGCMEEEKSTPDDTNSVFDNVDSGGTLHQGAPLMFQKSISLFGIVKTNNQALKDHVVQNCIVTE